MPVMSGCVLSPRKGVAPAVVHFAQLNRLRRSHRHPGGDLRTASTLTAHHQSPGNPHRSATRYNVTPTISAALERHH